MASGPRSAHEFVFEALEGGELPLSAWRGQAVLVVNTASACKLTPQYAGLQSLWQSWRDRGLVVLGVPSNDFGRQEPLDEDGIRQSCNERFQVDFPLAAKTRVRGSEAHPFFRWAAAQSGPLARPRWNFHKYLVAPDGTLADWFSPLTGPRARRLTRALERTLSSSR